jgi:Spy/CpxP family protein refolding chaperone
MKKKTITAVAVLALGATLAFAAVETEKGGKGGWEGHRGSAMMNEDLTQKLNLSDAQKQEVADLNKSFRESNKALFQSMHETREAFKAARDANDTAKLDALRPTMESQRAQMKQLRDAQDAKVRAILTPEQRAQLDTLKAEHRAQHKEQQ